MADIMLDKLSDILTEKTSIQSNDLIQGYSFLGINGTFPHINTANANAIASDIITGYSGYNNTEQLINGTNNNIDYTVQESVYVVNPVLYGTEINVNNQILITPLVRAYKSQASNNYFNLAIMMGAIEILDDNLLGKTINITLYFWVGDTQVYTTNMGGYVLQSTKYRASSWNGGYGTNVPNVQIDKVTNITASFYIKS